MHNDTELVIAITRLSAAALGYSTLKKLLEEHCRIADYGHVRFVHIVNPAQELFIAHSFGTEK